MAALRACSALPMHWAKSQSQVASMALEPLKVESFEDEKAAYESLGYDIKKELNFSVIGFDQVYTFNNSIKSDAPLISGQKIVVLLSNKLT